MSFCGHGPSLKLVEIFRRQERSTIRYGVQRYVPGLPADYQDRVIAEVLAEYARAVPLEFERTRDARAVDLILSVKGIDGPGGTLAEAHLPNPSAVEWLWFDSGERWDESLYPRVLRHELGHSLGLGHSTVPTDVMAPQLSGATRLQPGDLEALWKLYGKRAPSPLPAPVPPRPTPPAPTPVPVPPGGPTVNFTLNREQWVKLAKGAAIAAAGAALTYVAEQLPGLDFGPSTPMVAAIGAIVINYLRKALTTPAA